MQRAFRARRIIPLAGEGPSRTARELFSPPRVHDDAVIVTRGGFVEAVEPYGNFRRRAATPLTDMGEVTLVPGLVNAHGHLELAHLTGSTVQGAGFVPWVRSLLPLATHPLTQDALDAAVRQLADCGTAHVGDVGNRATPQVAAALAAADIGATLFCECFGYTLPDPPVSDALWPDSARALPPDVFMRQATLAGHALFSTHPVTLAVAKRWCSRNGRPFSIHLAEHPDEVEFLTTGKGALADMLAVRVLPEGFEAPGVPPVRYAAELGLLDEQTVAVHCTQCTADDAALLAASGTWACLCPRSNAVIGEGAPPVRQLIEAGVGLCCGTDSLASNHDLDLWNEVRTLRDMAALPAAAPLRMATVNGAAALGLAHLGTLEPGRRAAFALLPDDLSRDIPATA